MYSLQGVLDRTCTATFWVSGCISQVDPRTAGCRSPTVALRPSNKLGAVAGPGIDVKQPPWPRHVCRMGACGQDKEVSKIPPGLLMVRDRVKHSIRSWKLTSQTEIASPPPPAWFRNCSLICLATAGGGRSVGGANSQRWNLCSQLYTRANYP